MRTKAVFKHAYNQLLKEIGALPIGAELGSEPELARILRVSRTTVRAAVVEAARCNLPPSRPEAAAHASKAARG